MSKLKEHAARYLTEAGHPTRPHEIECVTGYNKRIDCYRWEIVRRDFICGCWLSLTEFVRECRKYGGAELVKDGPHWEAYPKYLEGKGQEEDGYCWKCDTYGNTTTCGAAGCGLVEPEPED